MFSPRRYFRAAFARVAGIVSAACVLAHCQSQATPLNLPHPPNVPDFMASFLSVSYDFSSSTFQALGFTSDYANGSASISNFGNYSLSATITHAGILTAGTLNIQGDIGAGPETLLTGTLDTGPSGLAFGFQDPAASPPRNIFEFLFTVTGGDPIIVNDFGGLGAVERGVILNAEFQNGGIPFNGTWTSSFNNDGSSGLSDNYGTHFNVPEPASAVLLLLRAGTCVAARRRSCGITHQRRNT
ncbi:MAG: hypothetical protein DME25_01905 [Verrucomicrobia bacterium]|nr:MAG: hypothetical protein DME25_01905 [Verrucomicrobiota bacterium]